MASKKSERPRGVRVQRRSVVSLLVGVAILTMSHSSRAQEFDNLKCYKVKDGQKFKSATVDLTPLDTPPFVVEQGCTLKGKAMKVCTPVDKQVVATDASELPVSGETLSRSFLCYKLKCPKLAVPDVQFADQFGARVLTKFQAKELCVPAERQAIVTTTVAGATTTTTTTTTLPLVAPCCSTTTGQCLGVIPPSQCSEFVIGVPNGSCDLCIFPPTQVCCTSGGMCQDLSQEDCAAQGVATALPVYSCSLDPGVCNGFGVCITPAGTGSCVPNPCPAGQGCTSQGGFQYCFGGEVCFENTDCSGGFCQPL